MAASYNPKTLAKTLSYILYRAPAEHGLFWDQDGSMPWKEFYWALQEDPSLRFVRESHLREIGFLGIDFPAQLDGSLLRLKPTTPIPEYPVEDHPPARLYYGCRRKTLMSVRQHGLSASTRPFLALASNRELALRMARRRDSEPLLVEVLAAAAAHDGIVFRFAGADLYLVEKLSLRHLQLPLMSEAKLQELAGRRKRQKEPASPAPSTAPGSFMVEMDHLRDAFGIQPNTGGKQGGKGRKGARWKRESRTERNKRTP